MAHLYKFTCKPNNPVVPNAVLVVWFKDKPERMLDALPKIASEYGCTYAYGNSMADYIGEIELTGVAEIYPDGVVTCITGEY